jgi:hypothetical protein
MQIVSRLTLTRYHVDPTQLNLILTYCQLYDILVLHHLFLFISDSDVFWYNNH